MVAGSPLFIIGVNLIIGGPYVFDDEQGEDDPQPLLGPNVLTGGGGGKYIPDDPQPEDDPQPVLGPNVLTGGGGGKYRPDDPHGVIDPQPLEPIDPNNGALPTVTSGYGFIKPTELIPGWFKGMVKPENF